MLSSAEHYKMAQEQRLVSSLEAGDFNTALAMLSPGTAATQRLGSKELTLIHYACRHGRVEVLLKVFPDCQEDDIAKLASTQPTPLHLAAEKGHLAVVRLLLQRHNLRQWRGDPDHSKASLSPLHSACREGHLSVAQLLIEDGVCDITDRDSDGNTPLHAACERGRVDIVKHLIRYSHADPQVTNSHQRGLLHSAATSERLDLVQYLVREAKVDPTGRDKEGVTPLHGAARCGRLAIVRWLIEEGGCEAAVRAGARAEGRTPLHLASIAGHLEVVKYLVDVQKCNVNETDAQSRVPVYLAAEIGSVELMRYLVEKKGCNPSFQLPDGVRLAGRTPLHLASFIGNLLVVQYLVEQHNCNPNCTDADDITPLMAAAQEGHANIVSFLCTKGRCDTNFCDKAGRTPQHYASLKGRVQVVKFLVESAGADVEIVDKDGETPVLIAARNRQLSVVEYLVIDCKCNTEVSSKHGLALIHYVASNDWVGLMRIIISERRQNPEKMDGAGLRPIHHAADSGAMGVLHYLIEERKCDPNTSSAEDLSGWTPLLRACRCGRINVVKYLVHERKASLKPTKDKLMSPLHLAATKGCLEIVQFLCEQCDIEQEISDRQGATPLHMAALEGHLPVVKYLICERQYNPMTRTKNDATAVHAACQGGHLATVQYLVTDGKCKSSWHDEISSPLMRAVEHGRMEVAKYLILNDICDPHQRDKNGVTVLHMAAAKGHLELLKFFAEDIGCDVLVGDYMGALPLHLACGAGHVAIASYLLSRSSSQVMHKDMAGDSPLQRAKKTNQLTESLLLEFLRYGADPSQLEQLAPSSCAFLGSYLPICPFVKVFLCGDIDSLRQQMEGYDGEGRHLSPSVGLVSGVRPSLETYKDFGEALFYQLRGELVSTGGILRDAFATCTHPVFVVGVSTSHPMPEIRHRASLWVHLLSSLLPISAHQPLLIFAVSEAGTASTDFTDRVTTFLLSLPFPTSSGLLTDAQVIQYTEDPSDLRGIAKLALLIGSYNNLLQETVVLPSLPSAVKAFISNHIKDTIFFSLSELSTVIRDKHVPLPGDAIELAGILTDLSHAGHLIFLRNELTLDQSWVITDLDVFVAMVQGSLADLPSSGGPGLLLQSEVVDSIGGSLDPVLLIHALVYLGLCGKFSRSTGDVFFFPHLVPLKPPSGLTFSVSEDDRCFGWFLRCSPGHVLPPHFCTMLPAALALAELSELSPSPATNERLQLWKGGAHWECSNHVSVLVNTPQVNAFLVLTKSKVKEQKELVELIRKRSSVIDNVFRLQQELCPHVQIQELIIDPSTLVQYSPESPKSLAIVSVQDMLLCAEDPSTLSLVGPEPYFIMGRDLLEKLFPTDAKEAEKIISDDYVDLFSKAFKNHCTVLACMLGGADPPEEERDQQQLARRVLEKWIANGKARYIDLRKQLDQYSIFAGRNPLVSHAL